MIERRQIESQSLKNFPLQQATSREYFVILPPGYSKSQKYPSLYLLSAWGNRPTKYLSDDSVFGRSLPSLFEEAFRSKRLAPSIIVLPDAGTSWGSSQFINSPAFGNFQDFIGDELVDAVDSEFASISDPQFRGVMGHSSGGFGALHLGFQRPDRFLYIASAAGDTAFELNLIPGVLSCLQELERAGTVEKFLNDFLSHPNPGSLGSSKMIAMMMLSLAPCYAPRPKQPPLFGELFFDLKTGRIREDIWQEYLSFDPVRAAYRFEENIKKLKLVLLDAGLSDEYAAQFGHRQLYETLTTMKANVEINEFQGRHSGHNHRFIERAERLLAAMTP